MGRRTVTDKEIALIKAMLSRGLKNRNIQFFFNRPDRPVNSGRISTIRSGTYSNSKDIAPASEGELDSYIQSFEPPAGPTSIWTGFGTAETSIFERAKKLFQKSEDGGWSLTAGEHERCECKRDFDPKKISTIIKTVAALANNKGGFIFFGVSNDGYRVEGIGDEFSKTDIVQIIEKVKAHLSPTPVVSAKGVIEFDGISVGFLHVDKYRNPPVIIYRDGDGLNEGEILFRYPGQSSRIKFGDLRTMLEERDRMAQSALAIAAARIADIGTSNAMIFDINKNVLEEGGQSILIDKKLAERLKFIKEGEFDEKLGSPTLKLVGDVTPVNIKAGEDKVVAAAIFQEDILGKFLEQATVDRPTEYIYAALTQPKLWLPIFYYVRMSGKSNKEIEDLVVARKTSQKGKKKVLVERLQSDRSAFAKAVTQASKKWVDEISRGAVVVPSSLHEAALFAQGLTGVQKTTASLDRLLASLRASKEIVETADDASAMGMIFKAACRVDELFFRDEN